MKTKFVMSSQGKVIGEKILKSDTTRQRLSSIEDRESQKYGAYVKLTRACDSKFNTSSNF